MKYIPTLSNTELKKRIRRKTNSDIVETIKAASESPVWKKLAKKLSGPTRQYSSINLKEIDKITKEGDTVMIIGKVLASGDLSKKVRICSLSISDSALVKLKKTKSEYATILEEININKKAEGVKIL